MQPKDKPLIPVILGPTAVGKTAAAIEIAQRLNGEIISADSRQIYREMNIGTAKPSPEELKRVKHHLIDILQPEESFSAGEFVRLALEAINVISQRGKLPIITGGAGLYIRALSQGIFREVSKDDEVRAQLLKRYNAGEREALLNELREVDPQYAQKVHVNDRKKLVRALEVFHTTGMTISELSAKQGDGWINPINIGLQLPREILYNRINLRVDSMIKRGLMAEVKRLRLNGCDRNTVSINSPGYIEIYDYLEGKIDLEEAVELIKRNTRRYAKRQITWFRKEKDVRWFSPNDIDEIIGYIINMGRKYSKLSSL